MLVLISLSGEPDLCGAKDGAPRDWRASDEISRKGFIPSGRERMTPVSTLDTTGMRSRSFRLTCISQQRLACADHHDQCPHGASCVPTEIDPQEVVEARVVRLEVLGQPLAQPHIHLRVRRGVVLLVILFFQPQFIQG
jgi:hypothetical protein